MMVGVNTYQQSQQDRETSDIIKDQIADLKLRKLKKEIMAVVEFIMVKEIYTATKKLWQYPP